MKYETEFAQTHFLQVKNGSRIKCVSMILAEKESVVYIEMKKKRKKRDNLTIIKMLILRILLDLFYLLRILSLCLNHVLGFMVHVIWIRGFF